MKKSELKQIIKEVIQEALPPTDGEILRKKFVKMRHEMTKKLVKDLSPQIKKELMGRRFIAHSEHFSVHDVVDTEIEYDEHNRVDIFAICIDGIGKKRRVHYEKI